MTFREEEEARWAREGYDRLHMYVSLQCVQWNLLCFGLGKPVYKRVPSLFAPGPIRSPAGLARYISSIYIIDIYRIYSRYFRCKISDTFDIFDIFNFYRVFKKYFNVTHCDYVLIFSLCVLLAYDLCPQHFLSVGQLLSDCTSPQQ